MKVLIIGGVAGGATAAARLRRLNERAEIVLFEKGGYISFANCGLPYHIGGVIDDRNELLLQTPESFNRRFNIDVRVFSEVISIDRAARRVSVKNLTTGEVYGEGYDKLILSPGAAPIRPEIPGIDAKGVFTLRNVADMDKIIEHIRAARAKTAVIAGGGYIGVEMAENLKRAGLDVSIIQRSEHVVAPLDYDMACDVHRHLRQNGVKLYLNNEVAAISKAADGLKITLKDGDLSADLLMIAVGVRPESGLASACGLAVNERGGIIVDSRMKTSDDDIYAVGDAVAVTDTVTKQSAQIPLAGPANKQGRIAADNICGLDSEYESAQGSAILKVFELTVATTGINEAAAKRQKLNCDKIYAWSPGHAGYYPGSKPMSIKVIFEKGRGKILGAQIVGFDGVDKRCDLLAAAVRLGLTAGDLTKLELCYAPPYGSAKDPVNMVGYMIENVLGGMVKNFHWHEVDSLPRDGSVTLLDVRSPIELRAGKIDGFINIPLDDLRARISELPKAKPVYVHCHSGQRSYIAARILAQNGYEAYNLSGGFRLYKSIMTR
ncbi:MAG: FAD-dependent oxidoreductase [Clostridiales bacterium]|jgi:NADPH-dependent 2,4-dienoyl-CoA reductase/sulfur reductase-like enzyme/rhodanese-related sulfurtransferase|nr:FAD-dependent oxidoreductase [Clostridiales bacterium]